MNKDIEPRNDKGQAHGYWEVYWNNGKIWYKCVYINGKKNGLLEYYYDNGQLHNKCVYLNGKKIGFAEWYWDGKVTDKNYYL